MQNVIVQSLSLVPEVNLVSQIFSIFPLLEHSVIGGFYQDGNIEDPLYDQLEQAMAEAVNSRLEALKEAGRRVKAEKDAVQAMRRVYFSFMNYLFLLSF